MSSAQEEEASGSSLSRSSELGPGGTAASDPQRGKKNSEVRSAGLEFSPGWGLTGLVPEPADFGLRTPIYQAVSSLIRASACLPGQLGGYTNSQPSTTHVNKNSHITAANTPLTLQPCQALPTLSIHTQARPGMATTRTLATALDQNRIRGLKTTTGKLETAESVWTPEEAQ